MSSGGYGGEGGNRKVVQKRVGGGGSDEVLSKLLQAKTIVGYFWSMQ